MAALLRDLIKPADRGHRLTVGTALMMCAGFDLGYKSGKEHFINNHLVFRVLLYKTNGQYTRARKQIEDLAAAAVVEVRLPSCGAPQGDMDHSAEGNIIEAVSN